MEPSAWTSQRRPFVHSRPGKSASLTPDGAPYI